MQRGKKKQRGEPVAEAVLAATLDDIAAHGPDAVSVARVAAMAGVNKTSIYRRWPTVGQLVDASIEASLLRFHSGPNTDTGTLQGDLVALVIHLSDSLSTTRGRALLLSGMTGQYTKRLERIVAATAKRIPDLVTRAAARGEWDVARHPPMAAIAMLVGAVIHRILLERQPADEEWARSVSVILSQGVFPGSSACASFE